MSRTKQELENIWRERVREARLLCEKASADFRGTWGAHFEQELEADPTFAIQHARKVESKALAEYVRTLRIFTDLILHNKMPPDEPLETKQN
jgi:hypothetical protein